MTTEVGRGGTRCAGLPAPRRHVQHTTGAPGLCASHVNTASDSLQAGIALSPKKPRPAPSPRQARAFSHRSAPPPGGQTPRLRRILPRRQPLRATRTWANLHSTTINLCIPKRHIRRHHCGHRFRTAFTKLPIDLSTLHKPSKCGASSRTSTPSRSARPRLSASARSTLTASRSSARRSRRAILPRSTRRSTSFQRTSQSASSSTSSGSGLSSPRRRPSSFSSMRSCRRPPRL